MHLFANKHNLHALYIPLADHYAAIVAYERYAQKMRYTNFSIEQMPNWDLLRAKFQSNMADMAYAMAPLAIDMYKQKPHFKWIGLMHRDGNALALNELMYKNIQLAKTRAERKPNKSVALAFKRYYKDRDKATFVALPHLLSTHAVVLYRYLKEHNVSLTFTPNLPGEVLGIAVAPPKSPAFLKIENRRNIPAAFEQSLPWADVAETKDVGKIAWYSKDIMSWKNGHVECIALATNRAIQTKQKSVREVMYYIHKAGADIELAKRQQGKTMDKIVKIIRKHIPQHSKEAIISSLRADLNVINYHHLNIDKAGLTQIMNYAIKGSILKHSIDIDAFADEQFYIKPKEIK